MSSSHKPNFLTYKADAAIAKGSLVKFGTDKLHVAKCTAASDKAFGIAQNDASAAEDLVEVALPGGGAKALCGAVAVAKGDLLTADSTGAALSTSTNADRYCAIAFDAAVSGDLFEVFVQVGIV